jgi:hypothetical protein
VANAGVARARVSEVAQQLFWGNRKRSAAGEPKPVRAAPLTARGAALP